ncbi:MAG: hypothetical protein ACE5GO_05715, partial [Anaerolineales bacterium]
NSRKYHSFGIIIFLELPDLRVAEEGLHKFERKYWISSAHFFDLYTQGLLDNGENSEEFSWVNPKSKIQNPKSS